MSWEAIKRYGVLASAVAASFAVLVALDTTGLKWWIWSWEHQALAAEAKELSQRLTVLEASAYVRSRVDIQLRLRDLRHREDYSNNQFLQKLERDLEVELHEVTRQLEKLGK